MDNDLISIIIPTYNRVAVLPNAINSILNQTYQNWELIIVDDHSTDNTTKLLESFLQQDSRIMLVTNTHLKGPAGARNCGIEHAKGKYLAFLDSDDQWLNMHLSESIHAFKTFHTDICFSLWFEKKDSKTINILDNNNLNEKINNAVKNLNAKVEGNFILFDKNFFEYTMTYGVCCYHINTLVIRRSILESNDIFNESLRVCEDSELIFRLLFNNEFCLIKKAHFIYNEGNDNIYNFIDRSNVNLDTLLSNKEAIKKLNICGTSKCIMFQHLIQIIKQSNRGRKNAINLCKGHIAYKFESLSYLNTRVSKRKSIHFMLMSCIYRFDKAKLFYMLKVLFSLNRNNICIKPEDINIW